jgi:hypothetical protein
MPPDQKIEPILEEDSVKESIVAPEATIDIKKHTEPTTEVTPVR